MALGERGLAGSNFIAERFFRSHGAPPATLENGFLPDPNGFMGRMLAGDVCTRANIHQTACSILLGEPGLGKSTTMLQRQAELPADSLFFDLRRLSAQEVLQTVRNCSAGAAHIVIDSVDEADLPSFPSRLVGELDRLPRGTIRLELACRASEWPETLRRGLPQWCCGRSIHTGELPVGTLGLAGRGRERLARIQADVPLIIREPRYRRGVGVSVELVVASSAAQLPGHEAMSNADHVSILSAPPRGQAATSVVLDTANREQRRLDRDPIESR